MVDQVTLLVVGFLLTSVVGGLLGYFFQVRTWAHQHRVERAEQEYQQAVKIFEEVSGLLDKRIYRMRRVWWQARRRARSGDRDDKLAVALGDYQDALFVWNDNLYRCQTLTQAYFGAELRQQLEAMHYDFIDVGRALDQFVREVSTRQDVKVPPLGRRLTRIGRLVYNLNLQMLQLLQERRIGRSAPQATDTPAEDQYLLQFGDRGPQVDRLQHALRAAGHLDESVDGQFGRATERALRDFQKARGLSVDAIAGPRTWAELRQDDAREDGGDL